MAADAHKQAVRLYFEKVLNQGDTAAADAILAPDIRFHYPLGDLAGADAVKDYVAAVRTAFPDITFTVHDLIGEGERVAARWSLVGSQTGAFRGQAPTGRRVEVPGSTMFHFVGDGISEIWVAFDPARFVTRDQ